MFEIIFAMEEPSENAKFEILSIQTSNLLEETCFFVVPFILGAGQK